MGEQPAERPEDIETVRTVGQLIKYSRELSGSDTAAELSTYAMEATYHVLGGHPTPTVVEVRGGGARVVGSMSPGLEQGAEPTAVSLRAAGRDGPVVVPARGTDLAYTTPETTVTDPGALGADDDTTVIAVPSARGGGDTVGVVLTVRWSGLSSVEQHHLKPLVYLSDHVATALGNIRTRERLERTRTDLRQRKEMIEVYDRLLRHDIGNDLQVIAGFAESLAASTDGTGGEQAERIRDAALSASELIDRVGDLVSTLEAAEEPEPTSLGPVVENAVANVERKFDSLTVEVDEFEHRVYAGDLLGSMVTNVLSNAAVHNDGPITVDVYESTPAPGTVAVGFADDGAGIDPAVREEVFEMGVKGPDSGGSGFGLGLVRALAESYGGGVELGESPHGGAEIRLVFERA